MKKDGGPDKLQAALLQVTETNSVYLKTQPRRRDGSTRTMEVIGTRWSRQIGCLTVCDRMVPVRTKDPPGVSTSRLSGLAWELVQWRSLPRM